MEKATRLPPTIGPTSIPGKRIHTGGFKVGLCRDGITKVGGVSLDEHGVVQTARGAKGERPSHEPPSRVLHSAASRDGAVAPAPRDAMAPCIAARAEHAYADSTKAAMQFEPYSRDCVIVETNG